MLVWYQQVDNAKSSADVVAIARDYFASWGPQEISLLPESLRPGRMRDPEDIEILHSRVVDEYRGTHATAEALDALQRMTSFVARAAMRIAELRKASTTGAATSAEQKSLTPRGS